MMDDAQFMNTMIIGVFKSYDELMYVIDEKHGFLNVGPIHCAAISGGTAVLKRFSEGYYTFAGMVYPESAFKKIWRVNISYEY